MRSAQLPLENGLRQYLPFFELPWLWVLLGLVRCLSTYVFTASILFVLIGFTRAAYASDPPFELPWDRLHEILEPEDEVVVTLRNGVILEGVVEKVIRRQLTVRIKRTSKPQQLPKGLRSLPCDEIQWIHARRLQQGGHLKAGLIAGGLTAIPWGFALSSYAPKRGSSPAGYVLAGIGSVLGVGALVYALTKDAHTASFDIRVLDVRSALRKGAVKRHALAEGNQKPWAASAARISRTASLDLQLHCVLEAKLSQECLLVSELAELESSTLPGSLR